MNPTSSLKLQSYWNHFGYAASGQWYLLKLCSPSESNFFKVAAGSWTLQICHFYSKILLSETTGPIRFKFATEHEVYEFNWDFARHLDPPLLRVTIYVGNLFPNSKFSLKIFGQFRTTLRSPTSPESSPVHGPCKCWRVLGQKHIPDVHQCWARILQSTSRFTGSSALRRSS